MQTTAKAELLPALRMHRISEDEYNKIREDESVARAAHGWRSDNFTACTCYSHAETGVPMLLDYVDTSDQAHFYKFE